MKSVDKDKVVPNSLGIPARASFLVRAKSRKEIKEIVGFAKKEGLPLIPLGDGTNIVPRSQIEAVVMILDLKGIEILAKNKLKVQAGENWDNVVKFAVEKNLSGIEALSGIPGLTGTSPIQNIGAYGTEIANHIESVEVYDKTKEEFRILKKQECDFSYRNSLFKKNPDKFIVTQVTLKLQSVHDRKKIVKIPMYKDVSEYFKKINNSSPTLREIREAIIEIRKKKLPNPSITPNAGSFFKNPILENQFTIKLKNKFPEIPLFPFKDKTKISAGWLIEQVGLKGSQIGKILVSPNNALVLTNPNHASFEEVILAKDEIQKSVFQKFGILLEPEVNIIQ